MKISGWIIVLIGLILAPLSQAQVHLSGSLSGTLEAGEYLVDSTVVINEGDTLIIQPGAHLQFTDWYPFNIFGTLIAEGTAEDSIVFDCDLLLNPNRWHGLRFENEGSSNSRLSYCSISHGYAQLYWPLSCGGGIFCLSTSPSFSHCLITACSASMYGGGVYYYNAPAVFDSCTISYNNASSYGGGVYASLSAVSFDGCVIRNNTSNTGGGIVLISSESSLFNTVIMNNSASTTGGIHLSGSPSAYIENCLVIYNSSTGT